MILSSVRGEGVDVSQVKLDDAAPTGLFFKERKSAAKVNVFYYRTLSKINNTTIKAKLLRSEEHTSELQSHHDIV